MEVYAKMKDEKDRRLQEVAESSPAPESEPDCAFCTILCQSPPGENPSDSQAPHFMTEREIQVLAAMRRLREEVSEIKRHMRQTEGSEDRMAFSRRLGDLREEWKKMDQERVDAAEERMRLLGHIQ
jgi:hypothetical protein